MNQASILELSEIAPAVGTQPYDVIIYTDPGSDDLTMLAQVLANKEKFNVLGVIAGAGNVSLDKTTINCLKLIELTGRKDIKLYKGIPLPTDGTIDIDAIGAFGESGIGNTVLPEPTTQAETKPGIDFAVETIINASRPITLIATGGLTDLYYTLNGVKESSASSLGNINVISIMGGVFDYQTHANASPWAEFNILFDPFASSEVFNLCNKYNLPVLLAPLDLAHTTLFSAERAAKLEQNGNMVSQSLAKLVTDVGPWDIERFGYDENGKPLSPVFDSHASMPLVHPELYQGCWASIKVISDDQETMGKTYYADDELKNVFVLQMPEERIDIFFNALINDISVF
jgi:purine nucleosidase